MFWGWNMRDSAINTKGHSHLNQLLTVPKFLAGARSSWPSLTSPWTGIHYKAASDTPEHGFLLFLAEAVSRDALILGCFLSVIMGRLSERKKSGHAVVAHACHPRLLRQENHHEFKKGNSSSAWATDENLSLETSNQNLMVKAAWVRHSDTKKSSAGQCAPKAIRGMGGLGTDLDYPCCCFAYPPAYLLVPLVCGLGGCLLLTSLNVVPASPFALWASVSPSVKRGIKEVKTAISNRMGENI